MPTDTATLNPRATRIFACDEAEFRERFDRRSFEFSHYLSGHPLFELPRLVELSKKLSATGGVYYDAGDINVDQRWEDCPSVSLSNPGRRSLDYSPEGGGGSGISYSPRRLHGRNTELAGTGFE